MGQQSKAPQPPSASPTQPKNSQAAQAYQSALSGRGKNTQNPAQGQPQPPPQQATPQGGGGVYPQAQAYRQYLQQPPSGPGARMSYNQFVESQGGPSPGMQASGAGVNPAPGAGAPQGPVDPATWSAYKQLRPITGQGKGAPGQAARAYIQKYGSSYDPEGILAKANALRGYRG